MYTPAPLPLRHGNGRLTSVVFESPRLLQSSVSRNSWCAVMPCKDCIAFERFPSLFLSFSLITLDLPYALSTLPATNVLLAVALLVARFAMPVACKLALHCRHFVVSPVGSKPRARVTLNDVSPDARDPCLLFLVTAGVDAAAVAEENSSCDQAHQRVRASCAR